MGSQKILIKNKSFHHFFCMIEHFVLPLWSVKAFQMLKYIVSVSFFKTSWTSNIFYKFSAPHYLQNCSWNKQITTLVLNFLICFQFILVIITGGCGRILLSNKTDQHFMNSLIHFCISRSASLWRGHQKCKLNTS